MTIAQLVHAAHLIHGLMEPHQHHGHHLQPLGNIARYLMTHHLVKKQTHTMCHGAELVQQEL